MTRGGCSATTSGGWSGLSEPVMPILYLIRHGENDFTGKRLVGRRPGVHLNERGQNQALLVGESLSSVKFRKIYSSPLERAVETAAPLSEALGRKIIVMDSLAEVDFGVGPGNPFACCASCPPGMT